MSHGPYAVGAAGDQSRRSGESQRLPPAGWRTAAGRVLDQPIDGGWLRADKMLLYPIFDSIPVLLLDEAIPMDQFE